MSNASIRPLLLIAALSGCTLHHVRDEEPYRARLMDQAVEVMVEKAPTRQGGERLMVTVEHPRSIDVAGTLFVQPDVVTSTGVPIESCGLDEEQQGPGGPGTADPGEARRPGQRRSALVMRCRYPIDQAVALRGGGEWLPLTGSAGEGLIGRRPWLLSAFVRGELAARVTGQPLTQGVDLGANFGLSGLLARHLLVGGRGDALIDTERGRGQIVVGPELGYVHDTWPCARCSVEATASYLVGYNQGLAHGPEVDLRFGFRLLRSGDLWHGIEGGMGYRHLIGPDSGGALIFLLSYSVQAALRGHYLPAGLRAQPSRLRVEPPRPVSGPADDEPAAGAAQGTGEPAAEAPR